MRRLFSFFVFVSLFVLLVSQSFAQSEVQKSADKDDKIAKAGDSEQESEQADKPSDSGKKEKSKDDQSADEPDDQSSKASDKQDDDSSAKDKSDKPTKKTKKPAKKKLKPHQVKTDKLKIEVKLDGTFVADQMEEIVLRPEVWSRFKVLEAVEHGTEVSKGDVLIRFDDEDLKEDLAKEALDQSIGQLSMLQDEEEFPREKRLLELSLESAERRFEQTKADYQYYHETDRPITIELAHFRYKSAKEQLASAQEELDQLQQMYDADEITEETEEIVLRWQRFAVETAKLVLELNQESRDYTLNVALPRSDQSYETSLEAAELAYKQAKTAVEMGATRKNYELEKKRNARAKSVERHGHLLSDKGLMTLRASCDGVVYYGKCTNGKFSQINTIKAKLKPQGTVTANSTIMTIVKPGGLHILSSIGEKNVPDVRDDMKATVELTADDEIELGGKVTHVDRVPGASNKFAVKLSFEADNAPKWLVAGMTCDAKVVTYENDAAVVVPQDHVQTDEDNKKIKYVMLLDPEEDEPIKRKVKLGRKQGKLVEVLKGLEAGDEIIKEEKKDDQD